MSRWVFEFLPHLPCQLTLALFISVIRLLLMTTERTQAQNNARTAERTKATFALIAHVIAFQPGYIAEAIGSIRNPESNRYGSFDQ